MRYLCEIKDNNIIITKIMEYYYDFNFISTSKIQPLHLHMKHSINTHLDTGINTGWITPGHTSTCRYEYENFYL